MGLLLEKTIRETRRFYCSFNFKFGARYTKFSGRQTFVIDSVAKNFIESKVKKKLNIPWR